MRRIVRSALNMVADTLARLEHISFPQKYGWRWKFEMLLYRYEPETTRLLKHLLAPGMTFADIGAHIGYFTRIGSRSVGATGLVFAFEPDEANRKLLQENTGRFSNVHILDTAVTDRDGLVDFYHVRESTGCHSTIPHSPSARKESVPATTLDTFMSRNSIDRVDVIKMDIEGGEWRALLGMKKVLAQRSLHLIMEYNPEALSRAGSSAEALISFLFAHGFAVSALALGAETPIRSAADLLPLAIGTQSVNLHCAKT